MWRHYRAVTITFSWSVSATGGAGCLCLLEVQDPGLGATALQREQPIAGGLSFLQIRGAEGRGGGVRGPSSDARIHFVGGEIDVCGGSVRNEAISWSLAGR